MNLENVRKFKKNVHKSKKYLQIYRVIANLKIHKLNNVCGVKKYLLFFKDASCTWEMFMI